MRRHEPHAGAHVLVGLGERFGKIGKPIPHEVGNSARRFGRGRVGALRNEGEDALLILGPRANDGKTRSREFFRVLGDRNRLLDGLRFGREAAFVHTKREQRSAKSQADRDHTPPDEETREGERERHVRGEERRAEHEGSTAGEAELLPERETIAFRAAFDTVTFRGKRGR